MHFADPNGEIQTVSQSTPLWPAAVVAGIKTGAWVSAKKQATLTALALDLDGKPRAGVPLEITGVLEAAQLASQAHGRRLLCVRQHSTDAQGAGHGCAAASRDARGLLLCEAEFNDAGEVGADRAGQRRRRTPGAGRGHGLGRRRRASSGSAPATTTASTCCPKRSSYQPGETARVPGAHAVPLGDRAGRGRTRRRHRNAGGQLSGTTRR